MFAGTIHRRAVDDEGWALRRESYADGRTLGVYDPDPAGRLVGTVSSFPSQTAVPGGAVLPVAAVTRVGVRADRTRRGLLTALVRAQLDDLATRGDVLAVLWSSQSGIYGRFGYGVATRGCSVRVRATRALRPQVPPAGSVRLLDRAEIVPVLAGVHDTLALRRPGGLTRPPGWWPLTLSRYGDAPLLAAVHTGPQGDDGFAVAAPVGDDDLTRTLRVTDLHAADTAASVGLWRFLLGVDLVTHVEAEARPLDEAVDLLLVDPRDRAVTGIEDETWLRLVDVPAALAAREFPAAGSGAAPVLLAVHDALLPDNTGIYRLGGGTAERVGPLGSAAPELECDVGALAMAYLGDRAPSTLAAAGWWIVRDPAAVSRADALFASDVVPWCGTDF